MYSLFSTFTRNSAGQMVTANVLAQPASGKAALSVALDAAVAAAGDGAEAQSATLLGAVDLTIAAAVTPATDLSPKALYSVTIQGSGGTMGVSRVLSNPQASEGEVTPAIDLAIAAAVAAASGATPSSVSLIGVVAIIAN
jgi:hypothetical protein